MAFQPVPDAAQVIIETAGGGFAWSNSLWFTRVGFTEADMDQLGVAVFNAWANGLKAQLNVGYQFNKVTIYDHRADGAPVREPVVAPVVGLDPSEDDPLGVAAVVTLYTATRGRSGRGRVYVGGLTAGSRTGRVITAAFYTAIVNGVIAAKNAGAAIGWLPVIVSRVHDKAVRPVAVTYPITSIVGRSNIVGSQDRRDRRP